MNLNNLNTTSFEIDKYKHAAYVLESIYKEAETVVLNCLTQWRGLQSVDTLSSIRKIELSVYKTPFNTTASTIGQILLGLSESDSELFWDGGQKDLCLKCLQPLHLESQKLKRKLERIRNKLAEEMKVLTPLLIKFSDDLFLSIWKCDEFNQRTLSKDSAEVEREALKIMAEKLLNETSSDKKSWLDQIKVAISCGIIESNKTKTLKKLQARLREIEDSDMTSLRSCKAFGSVEDVVDAEKSMLVWNRGIQYNKILLPETSNEHSEVPSLLGEIVSNANTKYFQPFTPKEEIVQKHEDIANQNAELNENEITTVLYKTSSSTLSTTDYETTMDENAAMKILSSSVQFPEDSLSTLKNLIQEARIEISQTTSTIRMIETKFYTLPRELTKCDPKDALKEMKHFFEIVKEAGNGLQRKLVRNERTGKNSFTGEQIDLMRLLGLVYRCGTSCMETFDSLTLMVELDTDAFEEMLGKYRIGETVDEEYEYNSPESRRFIF